MEGTKFKTPQQYIDFKANKIIKKVGPGQGNIIFSHLNVPGIIPGTEKNLLKKSEVWLPDSLIHVQPQMNQPLILQGHIHSQQTLRNVHVIGSPIFVDFGEKEVEKYFAVVNVAFSFGEETSVELVKTKCRNFFEFFWDNESSVNENISDIKKNISKDSVVKINAKVSKGNNINWNEVRDKISEKCFYVKPIVPRFTHEEMTRNKKQTLNLDPLKAVKTWIKNNKPERMKERYQLAKRFINED